MFVKLAIESLKSRKGSVALTLIAITISVFVLLAVEHIRHQAKESFNRTVSGVDLIVGPRSGQINLLLSSVFRLGSTNNSISWEAYEALAKHPMVTWTAPIALGDSHRGLPVIATKQSYFEHFRYGNKQLLKFAQGRQFETGSEVVLGAEVAEKFRYELGKQIVLSHGTGVTSFSHHDQAPFTIVGILERTGTPVDQSLHISFEGLTLMHADEQVQPDAKVAFSNQPIGQSTVNAGSSESHDKEHEHKHDDSHHHEHEHGHEHGYADEHDHENDNEHDKHNHDEHKHDHGEAGEYKVSAVFVGLKARYASLVMQKWANDYAEEPLSAILPGVALTQLWRLVGSIETVLQSIAVLVLMTTLIGLATMLLTSMRERQREIAILRVMGASPFFLFALIQLEVIVVTAISCLLAIVLLAVGLNVSADYLASEYGLFISTSPFAFDNFMLLGWIVAGSAIVGLIPAINAYRHSLQANLQNRR